jgi:MFS family permease
VSPARPRPFHGWTIVAALSLTTTVSYGVLYYAFGVIVKPMEAELGLTRAQTSGAFSLALLASGLAAVPLGRLVDRRGARGVMTAGSLLGALLTLAWSRVSSLAGLYAVFAGLGLCMAAVFYEVAFTVVAVWFRRHRARATLLITLAAGFASTVFVPLSTALTSALGWRSALAVLAGLLALATVPAHALVLRRRPGDLGLEPDGEGAPPAPAATERAPAALREVLARPAFRWLALAFALQSGVAVAVAAHLVPLLLERRLSPALAASAAGAVGAAQVLGRLAYAPLGSSLSPERATVAVFALRSFALGALLVAPGPDGAWLFAAAFGASNGALTLARANLVAERFGASSFGSVNGTLSLAASVAGALAPLVTGALRSAAGSYAAVLWALLAASLVALPAALRGLTPVRPRPTSGGSLMTLAPAVRPAAPEDARSRAGDYVITVRSQAEQACPVLPGRTVRLF